jgi:hypothetical protein
VDCVFVSTAGLREEEKRCTSHAEKHLRKRYIIVTLSLLVSILALSLWDTAAIL